MVILKVQVLMVNWTMVQTMIVVEFEKKMSELEIQIQALQIQVQTAGSEIGSTVERQIQSSKYNALPSLRVSPPRGNSSTSGRAWNNTSNAKK